MKAVDKKISAVLVLVTVANESQGEQIARAIVEERLAACVNIVGSVRSIYRWQDKIEDERESLLLIKTTVPTLKKLEARVKELHSYDVPEFLVIEVDGGSAQYLSWLLSEVALAK